MAVIEYEKLVQEYNNSLANVLRGFRPKYDFLELWVPDADNERSIINLVESAQSFGVPSIELRLEQDTITNLNLSELKTELETMGTVEFNESGSHMILTVKNLVEGEDVRKSEDLESGNLDSVPAVYRGKMTELLKDVKFEGSVQEDDTNLLIRSFRDGVSLFAAVDTEKHIIRQVAFSGAFLDVPRALLEGTCQIINETSIQDASDYGLIKLEWMLRDHSQASPVDGIVNPFNMDQMFQLPHNLLRELLDMYREKTGYSETRNFWNGNVEKVWREASEDERKKRVQIAVDRHAQAQGFEEGDVVVAQVDKTVKVSLSFTKDFPSTTKAKYILSMERVLRQEVEQKIELYQEMWKDKNRTRRL